MSDVEITTPTVWLKLFLKSDPSGPGRWIEVQNKMISGPLADVLTHYKEWVQDDEFVGAITTHCPVTYTPGTGQ